MALKDKWKNFGKNTGRAFGNLGRAIGKTAEVAFGGKKNEAEEGGGTELGNAWRAVGHGFGDAGKSLGTAAQGTAQKVVGAEKDENIVGGTVILLNGPSSSGKSTLAKTLQTLIEAKDNQKWEIVSIDDFLEAHKNKTVYEDDVYAISHTLCSTAIEKLRTVPGVIIDHVITSERIFVQLKEMLRSCRVVLVHVTCPLDELKERETKRGDRCVGSAEASTQYLYPQSGYDLTVDTAAETTASCAASIYKLI